MVEGEAVFVAKVVNVDVCKQWLYRITTAFHNFDGLFLRDKTTLQNCFGMNGHQKTLSFILKKAHQRPFQKMFVYKSASVYL